MTLNARTIMINLILVAIVALAGIRFYSEWQEMSTVACADIRNHLHPARRLMAGFDPNWYVTPMFEEKEFIGRQTPKGLRQALSRDGLVSNVEPDIEALNLFLSTDILLRQFQPYDSEPFKDEWRKPLSGHDQARKIRRFLETRYPLECPLLGLKSNFRLNQDPTIENSPPQSGSPSYLVAFYPIYKLPLSFVQEFWFFLTWGLALLSVWICASCVRWKDGAKLVWIVALTFIATSYSYHLHIIRGQKYVIYLFFISLAYYFIRRGAEILSGFIIGFLITFRPNVLLMVVPFLFLRKKKIVIGVLSGVIFGIVLPIIVAGPMIWASYFSGVNRVLTIKGAQAQSIILNYQYGNSFFDGADSDVKKSTFLRSYSPNWFNVNFYRLPDLLKYLGLPFVLSKEIGVGLTGCFLFFLLISRRWKSMLKGFYSWRNWRKISDRTLFLIGSGLFLISNYFSHINYSYTDVLWLFPLALIIASCEGWTLFKKKALFPVIFFLFFSAFGYNWFPVKGAGILFADTIMSIFLLFFISGLLVRDLSGSWALDAKTNVNYVLRGENEDKR